MATINDFIEKHMDKIDTVIRRIAPGTKTISPAARLIVVLEDDELLSMARAEGYNV